MGYYYENDITRTSANLQSTVAYLVSLHKNEYEWNMLGIKVVGHIDQLPIPDGQYDYGDAYMVGTETPYDMWIYTRADAVHQENYWFNVGKFPAPGPTGPAGPGLIDVTDMSINQVGSVQYDNDQHMTVNYLDSKLKYTDPNTHEVKEDEIDNVTLRLPIEPGKYITMDSTPDNNALEIKVDETALSLDYIKWRKELDRNTVPVNQSGKETWYDLTYTPDSYGIAMRNEKGDCQFNNVAINKLISSENSNYSITYWEIADNCLYDKSVAKTSTNTGTLSFSDLQSFQHNKRVNLIYDNQVYYRMDPTTAPDGTLNYIHIDAVQNGSGGYKATGKCFSITVATKAWQLVDLDFGSGGSGSTEYAFTHHIHFVTTDNKVYAFDISTHDNTTITFDDLMANFDGLVIHGVQAPETASTTFTPAIYRVVQSDNHIELLSADMSVLSAITKDNISQEEDYVTESQPN